MMANKIGPREIALREMRAEQCKIDHSDKGGVPKELCRVCTPVEKSEPKAVQMTAAIAETPEQTQMKKWRSANRIPATMSDDEARQVVAKRDDEKKQKAADRIEKLKVAKQLKENELLAKANEKRKEMGLPPIESNQQETDMTKKSKGKKAKTVKSAKAKTNGQSNGVRAGSKAEIVAKLLLRADGCTNKQVLTATGWPTVSMPAQAKAAGLKLRKEKTDSGLRYYGSK